MAVNTSTTAESLSNLIREELPKGIRETLPAVDPVFKEIQQTSSEVVRDAIGRDWKIRHNLELSTAGGLKWVNPLGGTTNLGSVAQPVRQSILLGTQDTFPSKAESPMVGNAQLVLSMAKMHGNLYLPEDYFQIDVLSASVVKNVLRNIRGFAKKIAHQQAIWFYMPLTGELATVSSVSAYTGTAALTMTPDNGRIRWFMNGMMVDIYNQDFTTNRTSGVEVIVDNVDYLGKTVRLVRPDGSALPAGIVNGDKIVWKNCYSGGRMGPYGLDNWIKDSGYLFDSSSGISVSTYSQLKSLVSAVSAALTENTLSRKIGTFVDAYDVYLDTVITTRGVTQGFMEQPAFGTGEFIFNRQGQALKITGGWADVGFVYAGRNYTWKISPYARESTLYVVKLGDRDLKRYVPPAPPNMANMQEIGNEIHFIAGLGGHGGAWKLAHNTDGTTMPLVEAPCVSRCQMAPTTLYGIKLTAITESPAIATTTTTSTTSTSTSSTSTTSTTTP